MKWNNAGEDIWLRDQTANKKLKQDTQTTQDGDSSKLKSNNYTFHGRGGLQAPGPPRFDISRRSYPVKFSQ